MSALANRAEQVSARDEKAIRRSRDRAEGSGAMYVASASLQALGLAHGHGEDTRQDSTARPALLTLLHRPGRVVTCDAIGCQVEVARQRVDQGGACILGGQENPSGWHR